MIELSMASGSAKDDKQDATIKQIADNQSQLIEIQKEMKGQIEVILRLLGITVTDSTIQSWRVMPKSLPLDSLGKPIPNIEWLSVSGNYLLGRTFKWVHEDSLLVRVEWDERPKE